MNSCRHNFSLETSHGAEEPPYAFRAVKTTALQTSRDYSPCSIIVHSKMQSHKVSAMAGVLPFLAGSRGHICRSDSGRPPRSLVINIRGPGDVALTDVFSDGPRTPLLSFST